MIGSGRGRTRWVARRRSGGEPDVAEMDVAQAVGFGNGFCLQKGFNGRGRCVFPLRGGMIGADVPRQIGTEVGDNPFCQGVDFGRRIVSAGNEQRGDFQMNAGLLFEVDERVEYRLERGAAQLFIE